MKAIVVREWGGPEVLNLDEVPDPKVGVGEVLIRLKAIGINPAETYMRSGAYAHLPDLPCVLGLDGAGVIESIGASVSDFEVGQRVYVAGSVGGRMSGCYAELVTRPADEVFPLPDVVSFPSGAAVGVPYATAYYALFDRGRGKPGEKLFIHGASGAVGTAAIQLARARRERRFRGSALPEAGDVAEMEADVRTVVEPAVIFGERQGDAVIGG